jgi:hypothetical protein
MSKCNVNIFIEEEEEEEPSGSQIDKVVDKMEVKGTQETYRSTQHPAPVSTKAVVEKSKASCFGALQSAKQGRLTERDSSLSVKKSNKL